MNRTEVKSSFIKSIGYEGDTLEVEMADGGLYRYTGVPVEVHQAVMEADSTGKAFRQHILNGGFPVEKVEPGSENG